MNIHLDIIIGPMCSGKSSELVRRARRHKVLGKRVAMVNSTKDTRESIDGMWSTHDDSTIYGVKVDRLRNVDVDAYDVFAVDEAQFFTKLYDDVLWLLSMNKIMIVAGLDGDFKQNAFGEILNLIPHCESVVKLRALCIECKDGTEASFTKRIVCSECQELVGGVDMYKPVCRKHIS